MTTIRAVDGSFGGKVEGLGYRQCYLNLIVGSERGQLEAPIPLLEKLHCPKSFGDALVLVVRHNIPWHSHEQILGRCVFNLLILCRDCIAGSNDTSHSPMRLSG